MAKAKTVQITKDDMTGYVLEKAVPAWERNGWTAVDDGSSESGEVPEAPPAKADQKNEGGDQ